MITEDANDEDCLDIFEKEYEEECVSELTEVFGQLFARYCTAIAFDCRNNGEIENLNDLLGKMRAEIFYKVFGPGTKLPDRLGYEEQLIN